MKYSNLIIILIFISCSPKTGKNIVKLNKMPMINGIFDSNEWSNSTILDIQSKFELYLKQDDYYFYIGIKNKTGLPFYVDMFFQIDESLYNIHSSSQLGERKLEEEDWNDKIPITHWGYLRDWNANTVLFDRRKFKKLRDEEFEGNISLASLIPYEGFEFQFLKQTWNLNNSKMRIEMRNMVGIENYIETIFPKDSKRKKQEGWHLLKFE